jgi:hypothetical protein
LPPSEGGECVPLSQPGGFPIFNPDIGEAEQGRAFRLVLGRGGKMEQDLEGLGRAVEIEERGGLGEGGLTGGGIGGQGPGVGRQGLGAIPEKIGPATFSKKEGGIHAVLADRFESG